MFKLTEEQVEKAVQWWADRVCAPVFDGLSDEERKDPVNDSYQLAEILASRLVKPVDADRRRKFMDALRKALQNPDFNPWDGVGVDYQPDHILALAAEKAGIPATNFPWKTGMSFYEDGKVKASSGYGTPHEYI